MRARGCVRGAGLFEGLNFPSIKLVRLARKFLGYFLAIITVHGNSRPIFLVLFINFNPPNRMTKIYIDSTMGYIS